MKPLKRVAILFLLSGVACAEDVFYLDEEIRFRPWEFGFSYGYELVSPESAAQSLGLAVLRALSAEGWASHLRLGAGLGFGVSGRMYESIPLKTQLISDYGLFQVCLSEEPQRPLELEFRARLGAGFTWYKGETNGVWVNWSFRPALVSHRGVGLEFAVGQEEDRWMGQVGAFARF